MYRREMGGVLHGGKVDVTDGENLMIREGYREFDYDQHDRGTHQKHPMQIHPKRAVSITHSILS